MEKLIILQMNEVNFDLLKKYVNAHKLKNFEFFLKNYHFIETTSEKDYNNLEPWIQWVSFYTGKAFKEHGVFYLSDSYDHKTFFEDLQNRSNLKHFLMCPMNLDINKLNNSHNIIPDPWSRNEATGGALYKFFFKVISKFVKENARKVSFLDCISLSFIILLLSSLKFKINFLKDIFLLKNKKYYKAIILDKLLFDIFITNLKKNKFNIYSVFLNSCAHIQHHYMLNSLYNTNSAKNPSWYIDPQIDPVGDIFLEYDKFLGEIRKFKKFKMLLVTGLSQSPIKKPIFYYNLKNPVSFFNFLDIEKFKLVKRMSRDYTLIFESNESANLALKKLSSLKLNDSNFFKIKQKIDTNSLYIEVAYVDEITSNDYLITKDKKIPIFEEINFLAIKNSIHNEKGYALTDLRNIPKNINIKDFYNYINRQL
jgi:hypothetical protein